MKISTIFKNLTLVLVSFGMVVPQTSSVFAANPQATASSQEKAVIADVALSGHGKLVGQVVDHQGTPRVNSVVTVATLEGVTVQKVTTDDKGLFSADIKRGGVYTVSGAVASSNVRVWTQQAAPPSANTGLLIVDDTQAARGNWFVGPDGNVRWLLIGATTAIIGGIIYTAISPTTAS